MTDEQVNHFVTLLMGECWHEWNDDGSWNTCKVCGLQTREIYPKNPDHLSNPLPVIKWMEKEMPEVWEEYIKFSDNESIRNDISYTALIDYTLDLSNLVDYLWEHQEWGEKECLSYEECRDDTEHLCNDCHGTGKIIHPALKYLKEVKG